MQRKTAIVHVRVDSDLEQFLSVLKDRPGGISRFVNDAIRSEKDKTTSN
jgi:hypothetical protein